MRFSAAIRPQPPLHTPSGAELIRRLLASAALPRVQPAPVHADEPPADLDQRVRLIGEW